MNSHLFHSKRLTQGIRQWLWQSFGDERHRAFRLHRGHTTVHEYWSEMRDRNTSAVGETTAPSFCLCPPGYADWSPRLVDAIVAACVPVLFQTSTRRPFQQWLNYDSFAVQFEYDSQRSGNGNGTSATNTDRFVRLLDAEAQSVAAKRQRLQDVKWAFVWRQDADKQRGTGKDEPRGLTTEDALLFELAVKLHDRTISKAFR